MIHTHSLPFAHKFGGHTEISPAEIESWERFLGRHLG